MRVAFWYTVQLVQIPKFILRRENSKCITFSTSADLFQMHAIHTQLTHTFTTRNKVIIIARYYTDKPVIEYLAYRSEMLKLKLTFHFFIQNKMHVHICVIAWWWSSTFQPYACIFMSRHWKRACFWCVSIPIGRRQNGLITRLKTQHVHLCEPSSAR